MGSFFLFILFICYLLIPSFGNKKILVKIPKGATSQEIAKILVEKKIIPSSYFFIFLVRILNYEESLKAGVYEFESPNLLSVLSKLKEGKVKTCKVTVPEGSSSWEIAELLSEKKITEKKEFLTLVKSPDYFKKEFPWIEAEHSLEGYLFPDTYYFALEEEPARVIEKFLTRFKEKVLPLCKGKDFSLHQILTMASIVEKETGKDFEKPVIAAVFYNRLKRGMKLMADPTVKYALKDFNRKLTRKDLAFPSLYNTYLFSGLPPGPICNPGIESIKAAISPAEVEYLYFVSRGDGTHEFSQTYSEHLKAIKLYQKG